MKKFTSLTLALLATISTQASAWEIDKWENHPIQIHGSFGQGWITTSNDDLGTFDTDRGTGDFSFNDFVLNGSMVLTDSLTVGAQIISRDFGDVGNNELDLDWAYLDYNINETLGFRAGRIKQPNGLYGDMWDLDIARTTVFLPPAYSAGFRDLFVSMDGVSAYGEIDMGKAGSLEYTVMYGMKQTRDDGSMEMILEALLTGLGNEYPVQSEYTYGGRLIWNTPVDGLRTSFSIIHSEDLDTRVTLGPVTTNVDFENFTQWYFSAEYTRGDWIIAAELRRLDFIFQSDVLAPGPNSTTSYGDWYLQVENQVTDKWAVAGGIGQSTTNYSKKFHASDTELLTTAYLSARYDIADGFLIKADLQYLDGKTGYYKVADPERNNWLLAMKAVYYF